MVFHTLDPGRAHDVVSQLHPNSPVCMISLLKFRHTADYSSHPISEVTEPISGREAFSKHYRPNVQRVFAAVSERDKEFVRPELILSGDSAQVLMAGLGARTDGLDENWDTFLITRYPSLEVALKLVGSEEYEKWCLPHRLAALEDYRIVVEVEIGKEF